MKNKAMLMSLLGALLALTSCRDLTLDPVFYALEKEQPLEDDRGFPDAAIVHRIVKTGTRYFAAANKLYSRTDGASDTWTVVAPPVPGAMCNTLEVFAGQIYAGFYDKSIGAGLGLYRSAPDPISWNLLGTGTSSQITLIKAVGSAPPRLFVATWSGSAYTLSHSTTGDDGDFTTVSWGTAPQADLPIIDVDSNDSYYWVVVGNAVYRDDLLAGLGTLAVLPAPSSGTATYGGVFLASTGTLYLSGGNGLLHSSIDGGGTWSSSAVVLDDKDNPVPFAGFALPASDALAVYVGTRGFGYYRIPAGDVTGSSGALVRSPAYNISALYNGAINCLLYDAGQSRLLLGTAGSGLWRGDHVSGSEWLWKQE